MTMSRSPAELPGKPERTQRHRVSIHLVIRDSHEQKFSHKSHIASFLRQEFFSVEEKISEAQSVVFIPFTLLSLNSSHDVI